MLLPPQGASVIPAGECRLACLPCSSTGGLEFQVWRSDGTFFTATVDGYIPLRRGETAQAGTIEAASDVFDEGPTFDLDLIFITNPGTSSLVWPFSSPSASAVSSTTTNGRASFQGTETEFILPSGGSNYSLNAYCTNGIV